MSQLMDYYLGVRVNKKDVDSLSKLVRACGSNQSDIVRYLIRTAAQHPDIVATGLKKAREQDYVR